MLKIRKFDLLVSIYIFCIMVSELMGAKTFPLIKLGTYQLNASIAIFVFPLIFTINDVITEVYGKEQTKSLIRSALIVVFLIMIFSLLAISLPPSGRFAESEAAYDSIFGKSARIAFASLVAFALAEFTDVLLFVHIRKKLGKNSLWLRNNVSNIVSQLVDTTIFMTVAFYGLGRPLGDNISFLSSIIIPYWLLKSFMSIIETPFVYLGVDWLKKDKV